MMERPKSQAAAPPQDQWRPEVAIHLQKGRSIILKTAVSTAINRLVAQGVSRWVVVNHAHVAPNGAFPRTPAMRQLERLGAVTIDVPEGSTMTFNRLTSLAPKEGHAVSFRDALKHPDFATADGSMNRTELEDNLRQMEIQFRQHAGILLPDVRVYDADLAGLYPLARHLDTSALGGRWTELHRANELPWWELPLGAAARGEHSLLWTGPDAAPPQGWIPLLSRAAAREIPCYWLPGLPSYGFAGSTDQPAALHQSSHWLGINFWSGTPQFSGALLERWKQGFPPSRQSHAPRLWRDQAQSARASRTFLKSLELALSSK